MASPGMRKRNRAKAKTKAKESLARQSRSLQFAHDEKSTICDPQVLVSRALHDFQGPCAGSGFVNEEAKAERKTQKQTRSKSLAPETPQSVTLRCSSVLATNRTQRAMLLRQALSKSRACGLASMT